MYYVEGAFFAFSPNAKPIIENANNAETVIIIVIALRNLHEEVC